MQKYQWINPTESFPWCSACNEVGLESWTLERVIWKVFIGERVHKEEQEIFMENWLFLFVDSIYTLCSQFSKRWIPLTTQTNIHHVFYQTNKSSSKFQIISLFTHLFTLIFPIRLNPSSFLLFLSPNTYFISPNTNNSTNNNSTLFVFMTTPPHQSSPPIQHEKTHLVSPPSTTAPNIPLRHT